MSLRIRTSALVAAALMAAAVGQGAMAAPAPAAPLDLVQIRNLAAEAYTWGLAPEFVYRFSHFQELVSAPVNTLKYGNNEAGWNNNATNAGDASVVYINAFVDFKASSGHRMVLTVPPSDGQYFVVNYLDNFVNGVGSIGNRTTPSSETVSYVLVGPDDPAAGDASVDIGGHTFPVLATDSNLNWLLIRIRANSLTDPADPESVANVKANVVQKFALNSLSDFAANSYAPVYPDSFANIVPTPEQVDESQLWQSAPTNAIGFFDQVGESLKYSPLPVADTAMNGTPSGSLPPWYIPQYGMTDTYYMPAYDQQPTLERFAPIGLTADGFSVPGDWTDAEKAALEAGFQDGVATVAAAANAGTAQPATNYWSYLNNLIGTYPNTVAGYLARAIIVLDGGSANVPLDAVYPTMNSNDGGAQLDGNNTYTITFTPPAASYSPSDYPVKGILPPMVKQGGKVAGFWSLVVYQPDTTSSSAPFIPQTSVLNTHYSDATSTNVVSVSGNTMTVNAPDWGPIDLSTPLIFGPAAAAYGLKPGVVYYVATQPTQPTPTTYSFELSSSWVQELSPGNVPIQQAASVGGHPGAIATLTDGGTPLTFGPVQPVSQLGSDQLNAGDLTLNADGSITIWLSPTLPAGAPASNWIPTPNTAYYNSVYGASSNVSTSIQAMIRMYFPTPGDQPPSILPLNSDVSTTYVLPALVKVNQSGGGSGGSGGSGAATTDPSSTAPIAEPPSTASTPALQPALPARNPQTARMVAPGVLILSSVLAAKVKDRRMGHLLAARLGKAPHVLVKKGHPVAVTATGLARLTDYRVQVNLKGRYADLGTVRSAADGSLGLPVVRFGKRGTYPIAVTPVSGGAPRYLAVHVQ